MPKRRALLLAIPLVAAVPRAAAQPSTDRSPVALGVSTSTIGFGPEVSLHLTPRLGLRAGYHWMSLSFREEVEDLEYEIRPDWGNLTALFDVHPFANAFRLTAGLVLWNTSADAEGVLTGPVEIGDQVFQPADVGVLLGKADYSRSLVPLLGLGVAGRGRVAVAFDVGVLFTGRPRVDLSANSPLTGPALATLRAEVQKEENEIRNAIARESLARFYPLVSLGLTFRL